jgi:hypothetical protein
LPVEKLMTQLFNCPACGAGLDYEGDSATVECPYCHNSVVVPAEIRQPAVASGSDFSLLPDEPPAPAVRQITLTPAQKRWILILIIVCFVLPMCIGVCATLIGVLAPFIGILLPWFIGGH